MRIPILGPMTQKQTLARLALVTSTLIRSGVVYLKAIEIAARSTRNIVVSRGTRTEQPRDRRGTRHRSALNTLASFPLWSSSLFPLVSNRDDWRNCWNGWRPLTTAKSPAARRGSRRSWNRC